MLKLSPRHGVMIAMLALAAYAPTLKLGFFWDDHVMIEGNPTLRQWSPAHLKHDFTSDVFDQQGDRYYRPLQTLSNRWDYTLWGLRPFGYHLTNFLFHLGNAFLIAELIVALGYTALIGLLAASLLAVHPIGVEQLMIIAGRAELMVLFFSLAALLLFLKDRRGSDAWGWAAYAAALLSKESAVVTPLLLGLVYYTRREPISKYKKVLLMLGALVPYLMWRRHVVGPMVAAPNIPLAFIFFLQEFPAVVLRYVGLLFVPWNLHSHRLLPHISPLWWLQLGTLIVGTLALVKKAGRPALFWIGWFLLAILPKTPVMIYGNFMLDHWAYPASPAIFFALAYAISWGWLSSKDALRALTGAVYFSALIAWALLVHLNVALRGTDEKMYRWALYFTTSNPVKYNLGVLLLQTGRPMEAVRYFEEVRHLYPEDSKTINGLALAYWQAGQKSLGRHILEDFLKQHPADELSAYHLRHMQAGLSKKMIFTRWAPRVSIVLLGLAAYGPSARIGFLYDDHLLIESNRSIQSGSLRDIKKDFGSGVFDPAGGGVNFYRPLQILSTRIEYRLWKLNPLPYHLANLALQTANGLLLYELIVALGVGALVAALAGCLFVTHPIIVEGLLMVSGRGELLAFFFSALTLILALRGSRRGELWSLATYLLALFSKESTVITPALLAVAFYYRKDKPARYRILIPMAAITALYLFLRTHALGTTDLLSTVRLPWRFLWAAFPLTLLRYARILIFPFDLHTDRLLPPMGPYGTPATLAVVVLAAWIFWKGPRWARFCFLWYVLTFLPKSLLMMSGRFMSDHWAYPALPALLLPLALALSRAWDSPRQAVRLLSRGAATLFLTAELVCTHSNLLARNTDEKLYRSALRYTSSATMRYNLGIVYLRQGRAPEALPYFQRLAGETPEDPENGRALAVCYWQLGRRAEAIAVLQELARRTPNDPLTLQILHGMQTSP